MFSNFIQLYLTSLEMHVNVSCPAKPNKANTLTEKTFEANQELLSN